MPIASTRPFMKVWRSLVWNERTRAGDFGASRWRRGPWWSPPGPSIVRYALPTLCPNPSNSSTPPTMPTPEIFLPGRCWWLGRDSPDVRSPTIWTWPVGTSSWCAARRRGCPAGWPIATSCGGSSNPGSWRCPFRPSKTRWNASAPTPNGPEETAARIFTSGPCSMTGSRSWATSWGATASRPDSPPISLHRWPLETRSMHS